MKKLFTMMALTCMALCAQAQGKYALEAGSGDFAAGTQVTSVANITLTFGLAGQADFTDPVGDTPIDGYPAYTKGNGVNGSEDGGTQYILQPAKNGSITVAVNINKDKALYVTENGTALSAFNGITEAEKVSKTYTFDVKGGKTYKVYCTGSKLGFYGFEYTVSDDQGGDEPHIVIPENSENYSAIVDGKLAPEFAAVAGESGGVANNTEDGKSIITIKAGKATVTAVGGTTPANDEVVGGGAQQIVPGAPVEGRENVYEVASVGAWNDVNWGLKNQGDIDFWYITGTGNPYVDMLCVQNTKDDVPVEGSYKAEYVYYEPDGSVGMPITGLYYKFTAEAQGAFKVKVWANKGHRKTFVVNAATKQAERLFASGYINGVNDADGKKKLLTVEQVDSVHNIYAAEQYTKAAKAFSEDPVKNADPGDSIAYVQTWQYVIGNGNQIFWGWLTFDVEPGEEYWVFQHSSQIGFGGFEFHEGITAEELIQGIEAAYVFTTNFSTYEDAETGDRVTWKGEKAMGNGKFASEKYDAETFKESTLVQTTYYPGGETAERELEEIIFSDYFQGNSGTVRSSYCLLPEDVLAHSANTQAFSLGVWMKAPKDDDSDSYKGAPLLTAYDELKEGNGAPLFALQYDGTAMLDNGTKCDYTAEQNVAGSNTVCSGANDWLADKKWHYYTAVLNGETAQVYIDGQLKNEWNCGSAQAGLFANGADLKYVALGGNQVGSASEADSFDAPFAFARLLIKNSPMTAGEIKAQMVADFPEHEAYWAKTDEPEVKGDVNGDNTVDVADISNVISIMADGTNNPAGDVNKDGSVDVADISSIITIMAGGE